MPYLQCPFVGFVQRRYTLTNLLPLENAAKDGQDTLPKTRYILKGNKLYQRQQVIWHIEKMLPLAIRQAAATSTRLEILFFVPVC